MDGGNQRLGTFVETSAGGERVRASPAAKQRAGRAAKRKQRRLDLPEKLDAVGVALLEQIERDRAHKAKKRLAARKAPS